MPIWRQRVAAHDIIHGLQANAGVERVGVSVLIITRNEARNIADCLATLTFTDDVVVLDSLSTDATVKIAKRFPNVRVFDRPFDTEYKQRNHGLHAIDYRHPWVYVCDADERVPPELARELMAVTADATASCAAYRLRYKNMFFDRWIKHATGYPVWLIRLVQPERVTYELRETNVHPVVDGPVGELREHFIHYSFNAGFAHWFRKHNFYSEKEAIEGVAVSTTPLRDSLSQLTGDEMARRRALKNLSFRLHGRGLWRFLYQYVIRLGFLDGRAGLSYCLLVSMYEAWIELKMREAKANWADRTLRLAEKMMAEDRP